MASPQKRLVSMAVVFLLSLTSSGCVRVDRTAASYKVYDAVITAMSDGRIQLHETLTGKSIAIANRTSGDGLREPARIRTRLLEVFDGLSHETLDDYYRIRDQQRRLENRFVLPVPYELATDINLAPPGSARFLEGGGLIRFSPVGISRSGREALVYVVHVCGGLCGTGHFVFLRLHPGGWKVERTTLMVIS